MVSQSYSAKGHAPNEHATWLILIAVTLVGIAHIALLPPWEGFDECAHWSSIQQITDTHTLPHYGHAYISADVDAYSGPMPYGTLAPPFDKTGRETYREFKESGRRNVEAPAISSYRPGVGLNWEAQHPPLFYLLMTPIYHIARGFGWIGHLFTLRLTAWALAVAGLAIGAIATGRIVGKEEPLAGPIMAGFPFLIPQFFPEMARLGNDSLCLLFMGIGWAATVSLLRRGAHLGHALILAVALGLGLLTKALFLPITVGIGALLAVRWWRDRSECSARELLVVTVISSLIGGWWYVRNYVLYGSFVGANDFLQASGVGIWEGMRLNFSIANFLRGLYALPVTFSLAGTWSLVRLPEILVTAPLTLLAVTVGAWLSRLKDMRLLDWAPAMIVGPFLVGLLAHLLHGIAMTGRAAPTPAWYLHVVAAPIGFAMAVGWRAPRLNAVLSAASVCAMVIAWWLQLSLFSGCSTKGAPRYYSFQGSDCIVDPITLNALTIPLLGAISVALAIPFLLMGLRHTRLSLSATQGIAAPLAVPGGEATIVCLLPGGDFPG
jgi:4-amino-4-deoxy-L-arabinose transferase-like glycosyltransferase